MRIVRVSLENLNSLRGKHAVDFSAEPIAGAGIFAITGPTGAGKTTILDAITLALYGRAARYDGGKVPEDMMSRHTGVCGAEVEFAVAEGVYRAVWQLRRSRGKADGRMQAPKRYLYDAAGVVLAEKVRAVDELVESLSGLDYERFMRSVLLAQGEFAKFLKAKPNDRAGLLESLTGTQVYSELGRLAYEEVGRREGELAVQEGVLAQLEVLEDEARKDLEEEEKGARKEMGKVRALRSDLEKKVGQAQRLSEALKEKERVEAARESFEKKRAAAVGELEKLEGHREVEPLIPALGRLGDAEEEAKRLEEEIKVAENGASEAVEQFRDGVRSAWGYAVEELKGIEVKLEGTRREIAVMDGRRRDADVWLKAHAGDAELGDALVEIGRAGSAWEHVRESLVKARGRLSGLAEEESAGRKRLGVAKGELVKVQTARERARESRDKMRGVVLEVAKGKTEDEWREKSKALGERKTALAQMRIFDEVRREGEVRLEAAEVKVGEVKAALERAVEKMAGAEEAWRVCVEVHEAHRGHLESAKQVASFEEHRAELEEGKECPLCGATEHPFVKEGARRGTGVVEIENKMLSAAKKVEEAAEGRALAGKLVAKLESERESADQSVREAVGEVRAAGEKMTKWGVGEFSEEVIDSVEREFVECESMIGEIRKAAEAAGEAERELAKVEAQMEKVNVEVEAREEGVKRLVVEREKLGEEIGGLEQKCAVAAEELAVVLRPYGVEFDKGELEAGWRELLSKRAKAYGDKVRERDGAEKELTRLQGVGRELEQRADGYRRWRDALAAKGGAEGDPVKGRWQSREEAEGRLAEWEEISVKRKAESGEKRKRWEEVSGRARACAKEVKAEVKKRGLGDLAAVRAAVLEEDVLKEVVLLDKELTLEGQRLEGAAEAHAKAIRSLRAEGAAEGEVFVRMLGLRDKAEEELEVLSEKLAGLVERLRKDTENRKQREKMGEGLEEGRKRLEVWRRLRGLIGSADGAKFSRFAQGISLDVLTGHANRHLGRLTERYLVRRVAGEELELEIVDRYQGGACRPMASLSGGESFLVSLALALGLSDLAGRNVRIDSLFIDEGFGALDSGTLDVAISALDSLRLDQKTVGVISHIDLLKERIGTQVVVEKGIGGVGKVRVVAG